MREGRLTGTRVVPRHCTAPAVFLLLQSRPARGQLGGQGQGTRPEGLVLLHSQAPRAVCVRTGLLRALTASPRPFFHLICCAGV